MQLKRLVDRGVLVRRARGIYERADAALGPNDDVALVALRAPQARIALLTALRLHGLTTQNPFDVWMMIDRKARKPAIDTPRVRVVRASGASLLEGTQLLRIGTIDVVVTTPAKTVADCFKYRSRVGLDVAVEALQDVWAKKTATVDELLRCAEVDRVGTIMRPYLELLR